MRPIANSDSCNTLVSLNEDTKGGTKSSRPSSAFGLVTDPAIFASGYPTHKLKKQQHQDDEEEEEEEEEDDGLFESHLMIRSDSCSSLALSLGGESCDSNYWDGSFSEYDNENSYDADFDDNKHGTTSDAPAYHFSPLSRRISLREDFSPEVDTGALRRLRLPSLDTDAPEPIDRYLKGSVPEVVEHNCNLLRCQPPKPLNDATCQEERVLNVLQGEVGHCTSQQADIIVSDRATTCHIIALWSKVPSSPRATPITIASLCHLDRADGADSLRDMVQQHKRSHCPTIVEIEVHLMGGYDDEQGTSVGISEFTLRTLSDIASENESWARLVLKTCAISSLNDDGFHKPIGRGLALNVASGSVFLASVNLHSKAGGPALDLRSCRLWSKSSESYKLHVISTTNSNYLTVDPFHFAPFPEIDVLLRLPDNALLRCTSTSPEVEEPDFCDSVRRNFVFLKRKQPRHYFGTSAKPLKFYRQSCLYGGSNVWELLRPQLPSSPASKITTTKRRRIHQYTKAYLARPDHVDRRETTC